MLVEKKNNLERKNNRVDVLETSLGILSVFAPVNTDINRLYFQTKEAKEYNGKEYVFSLVFKVNWENRSKEFLQFDEIDVSTDKQLYYNPAQDEINEIINVVLSALHERHNVWAYVQELFGDSKKIDLHNKMIDLLEENERNNKRIKEISKRLGYGGEDE